MHHKPNDVDLWVGNKLTENQTVVSKVIINGFFAACIYAIDLIHDTHHHCMRLFKNRWIKAMSSGFSARKQVVA